MGKVVGGILATHVPRLFLEGAEREAYIGKNPSSFFAALPELYDERLRSLDFDTFIVIDTHWWTVPDLYIDGRANFSGVYTSDEAPKMIRGYHYHFPGDPELAALVERRANEQSLLRDRVEAIDDPYLSMHYATLMPMRYFNPSGVKRVVPMSIAPTSSVNEELAYGKAIHLAVEESDRNVVIVASGGLSHEFPPFAVLREKASPDLENIPAKNRLFDEDIIRWLKKGEHRSVLACAMHFRRSASPEGRFAHYLRMIGALGGADCTLKGIQYGNYEAAIGTGQVILWFDV